MYGATLSDIPGSRDSGDVAVESACVVDCCPPGTCRSRYSRLRVVGARWRRIHDREARLTDALFTHSDHILSFWISFRDWQVRPSRLQVAGNA